MSEIVNDATIRVTADASGVEAGLRPAIDAAQRAERAISGIGAGSNTSARAQQNLIQAIQRTTAQMEAGSRTGARYWEILARQRGVDPNLLRPYLDQLRAVEQAQRDASTTAEGAGASIKDAIGGALAGLSIVGLLQQVVAAQREFDVLNASLITAVGTTERAAQAFDVLQGFAASTPYSVQQATEAFIQLRNMGLDPSERALRSYGNTAAAMGKDLSQMVEAVADAATGEFERLKEFGIKASQQGGKVSLTFKGVTTTIANNASEIEKYLQKLGEVDFASAMAQRADTLDGSISNLGDTWSATMRAISANGIGDAAKEGMSGLSASLQDLQAMLNAVSEAADKQGASLSVASGIHVALTTIFEALTVVGLNVAYVFKQIGMGIGGAAAQATALAQGNFAQVKEIRRLMTEDMARDRREVDAQSAAILGAAEKVKKKAAAAASTTGNVDLLAQYRIEREKERESDASAKKREEQYRREAAALAELSGLSASFAGDWKMLSDLYAKGSISLERLTSAQADLLAKQPAMKAAAEQEVADRKALAEASEQYAKAFDVISAAKNGAVSDLQAQRDENAQIGLGAVALAELNAMRLEDMALRAEQKIMMAEGLDITGAAAQQLRDEAAALRERAAAVRDGAVKQAAFDTNKQALDELNQFLDPGRAETFGEALREAFGGAGDAISKMTSSLDGFARRQEQIAKARATAEAQRGTKDFDEIKYQKTILDLNERDTKNRLSGYGAMANAAAGFFDEQSKGYKALQAVSQVFHAAELAMTLAELVPKGISAVLSQGSGDPYTAFGRMAAMAAVVAGLGVAIGGVSGGGVSLSESRQKAQGRGSVLGSDEKSESIANSLALIESSTLKELNISTGMLASLRNIEAGIGQFASLLVRTTGVTGEFGSGMSKNVFDSKALGIGGGAAGGVAGAAAGAYVGMGTSYIGAMLGGPVGMALGAALGAIIGKTFIGKALGSIFGGKQTVEDTGFTMGSASFGSIINGGVSASQYADIKKDGGWFRSDKKSTQLEGIGAEGNRQISTILTSLYDTVFEAGTLLGIGGDAFANQLNSFVVDIGKVSLKGKTGDQIQEELSAIFSKVGDDLASFSVAGITQFQKVGEGALETLARVAVNYASLDAVLASVGKTFGATGLASLGAREDLLTLAGGIDELASQTASFAENFLSESERLAPVQKYVTDQLASMGLSALRSRDSFKQYVLGLDLTNVAQREQYVALMDLQEAYAKLYPEIEDATKTLADARSELTDAYNAENDAISSTIDRMGSFVASLKSLRENALLGSLSPLSPQEKYAEAKAQYEAVLAAARGGDESAQSNYSAAFNSFLTASRAVFASSGQYQADFAYAQASTAEAERWAGAQVDVGKAQLDALKLSVSGLITLDKSVLSVRDAILQMHQVMGTTAPVTPTGIAAPPQVYMPTPVMYSSYGTDSSVALVSEIKRLNGLVEKLTAEQKAQTGDIITANARAASDNADRVAGATTTAVKSVANSEQRVAFA